MSHLFALLARMKHIRRWGLMRCVQEENIQEHSLRVAMIAHALAVIGNARFGTGVSPERVALLAIFHDAAEVLTGDLPTPVKYYNPKIKKAFGEIEDAAAEKLLSHCPEDLRGAYEPLLKEESADNACWRLVKAADKLCAYLKCVEEETAGNTEFSKAKKTLHDAIVALHCPEADVFLQEFAPSFRLTLDELE